MFRNSNLNSNFLIPNNQDFNDDDLENELQAILNENKPQTRKNSNINFSENKNTNNLTKNNFNDFNSKISQDLYQIDLNKLNLDDNVDDDQNFDENDPDLNRQLADIIGQEYNQNIPQASFSQVSVPKTFIPQVSNLKTPKNEIPKKDINTNFNNENCLLLQNSHFFNQNEIEKKNFSKENEFDKEKLEKLRDDYKNSALKAKKENDLENAKFYFKKYKELVSCLEDMSNGKIANSSKVEDKKTESNIPNPNKNVFENESTKKINAPSTPKSFVEDLELRKNKIKESYQKAVAENDERKIRTFTRVIKQFENAIKSYQANKEFDYSSLPVPPGFDEIPKIIEKKLSDLPNKSKDSIPSIKTSITNDLINKNKTSTSNNLQEELEQRKNKFNEILSKAKNSNDNSKIRMIERILKNYETALKANKLKNEFDYLSLPVPPGFEEISQEMLILKETESKNNSETQVKTSDQIIKPKPVFKRASSINDKQLDYLLQRQKLFREAAIESKKRNDISQAKEYLKKSKGFDPLIDAVRNGLPIDASSIPTPPQLEDDFVIVSDFVENTEIDLNQEELYDKLTKELNNQIELCNKNKENFLKIGDVSTGSKFEKYLTEMKKDYEMLKSYRLRNEKVPKFRYENKIFSIVVCNTDLQINEISIQVIRGIDYPCKNPIDSYVKFEFPFPKDSPQPARTHSFKNSLYPEYNQLFKFTIDRKSRSLARVFKKPLKFEVYSKGGFFKSDELIGYANIPLSELEKKCTVYDSFVLMNGRKEIGGKLQVRVKIREPLFAKQIEEIKEKWLIFS